MTRKYLSLAIFAILVLTGGCSNNETKPAASVPAVSPSNSSAAKAETLATNPEITVLKAAFPADPNTPSMFLVGDEMGFFKKNNLQLDFVGFIPSTQLVAAVVSGQIDVSHGAHINRTIAGISSGAKIKAVVGNTETTEKYPHMVGVVKKGSPLKKPQDFIGKKFGLTLVGGCHEYTPYAWLKNNGIIDPKNKVEIIILSKNVIEQSLRQGEIDIAMLHKTPGEIERSGEFEVVFSDYDVWGPDGGATPPYFTTAYIKENPQVVKNFVKAMTETLNWANLNVEKAVDITARRTNYDPLRISPNFYTPNGIIKPVTAQVWIDLLVEFGEIKPGITLDQIYTNEFNPYYKPQS
ncbi:MAG: ABC transporter substrate-binding protein [Deltaproteobacteria bacterium]|jgi:ABC-type nitrate/sulfonate/bicarbonate transport system substrate-binding protein|nr:ABC transporter substrate-binding protein [Deltaproteobacteria bacterium]